MARLTEHEHECLRRYCALLRDRLGEELVRVRLFGSAARGDMWSDRSPMHSDVDLLVETRAPVPAEEQAELVDATYALYLECGRQISPKFVTEAELREPADERARDFARTLHAEAVTLWPDAAPSPGPSDHERHDRRDH